MKVLFNSFLGFIKGIISSSRATRNVIWNLIGGLWAGILIVIATPWYVSILGLEGYAIVGLWSVMQVMMGLLDIGLGAALLREFADSRRDSSGNDLKRNLLRTLEIVYWAIAGILTLILVLAAAWIEDHWLQSHTQEPGSIGVAIQLMAIALGLQFPCGLYSNGLAGLQEHWRLNVLQIMGNTLRYGVGLAMLFWRADLIWFFAAQTIVAAVQTFWTRRILLGMIYEEGSLPARFNTKIIQSLWRFSTGMAITSVSAALLANIDRIALSKMVSTEELGRYAIAFTATGLIQMGIQPFYRAFFPRYTELVSTGDIKRLHDEYFRSCQLMAIVIIPLGMIGWSYAPQILFGWLGKYDQTIIDIFRWLLIGTVCSGIMWLPAAFQQAHGWTSLHATLIIGALLIGIPIMLYCINTFGVIGATAVWFIHGLIGITIGPWLMHRRLLKGVLLSWYISVLIPPLASSLIILLISEWLYPLNIGRWANFGWIALTMILGIFVSYKVASHLKIKHLNYE
jgi:O-antigen/teichoic acid export membrane protein